MDTGAFVGQLLKLGIALAFIGGTVKLIGQYDERAAWFIVVIILLSIMVFQSSRTSAIDDFLGAVFGSIQPLGG